MGWAVQKLSEIRELLLSAGKRPQGRLGQRFLIDANLMSKLLELAELAGDETVLEVGAATGSLTEELLERAGRVVAVELDSKLAEILLRRLGGRERLTVLNCDVLAGKHALAGEVLGELAGEDSVHLVANLPYNIAVPLILNCLLLSWRAVRPEVGRDPAGAVTFGRLTFTIQRELAERLTAEAGGGYGPAAVIVALLARATPGRAVGPEALWPRPKVDSQILRLDFEPDRAGRLADAAVLSQVLSMTFGQRRKKIIAAARRKDLPFGGEAFLAALDRAGIDRSARPEQVPPAGFLALANTLAGVP